MLDILFRAKNKETGDWEYGFLGRCDGQYVIEDFDGAGSFVDRETVGQFTGLFDKNGQRIFEGDVLLFNKGRNLPNVVPVPEVVKFHQGDCAFQRFPGGYCITKGGAGKLLQPDMMSECEVVGNIYDEN